MLALALRYLNGWAMAAADGARKERAEWPPHPDRVFMALAAAWFETGEDPAEGEALRWLETLGPPEMTLSQAEFRTGMSSYVPVNDTSHPFEKPKKGKPRKAAQLIQGFPLGRRRTGPRGFPMAIPHRPVVHFIWPEANPTKHRPALESLVSKVTHVGHSASLVQAWLTDTPDEPVWVPVDGVASLRLRVPTPGRLDYLKQRYNYDEVCAYADLIFQIQCAKGKEKSRLKKALTERFGKRIPSSLRPEASRWQGYRRHASEGLPQRPGSIFDPNIVVLTLLGKHLFLPATLKLTQALRGALMAMCAQQPPPEWLTGHKANGQPSPDAHLAMFPLPFVGARHADGRIMGLGLALPAGLDPKTAARCLGKFLYEPDSGLPRRTRLFDGKWFTCEVELETRESPPLSLQARPWIGPARVWASVTPVVLDRHFDGPQKWDRAGENVKDACERIGLPRPKEVVLHPVSLFEGVPHAKMFPGMIRKSDGGRRFHSHAVIIFEEPVQGPLLVGAGRFKGYGLCRPTAKGGD